LRVKKKRRNSFLRASTNREKNIRNSPFCACRGEKKKNNILSPRKKEKRESRMILKINRTQKEETRKKQEGNCYCRTRRRRPQNLFVKAVSAEKRCSRRAWCMSPQTKGKKSLVQGPGVGKPDRPHGGRKQESIPSCETEKKSHGAPRKSRFDSKAHDENES